MLHGSGTTNRSLLFILVVGLMCSSGCSQKAAREEAVAACEDFRDILIDAGVRCSGTTEAESADDIDAQLDCSEIRKIRDKTEFYDQCFPEFEDLSCNELFAGVYPDSCEDQLIL